MKSTKEDKRGGIEGQKYEKEGSKKIIKLEQK
jgi:hypothetical protein